MKIIVLITIAVTTFVSQCGPLSRPAAENSNNRSQSQSDSESLRDKCDFSAYNPFEVGMIQAPVIDLPKPPYPTEAKAQNIDGRVVVKVLINLHSGVVD